MPLKVRCCAEFLVASRVAGQSAGARQTAVQPPVSCNLSLSNVTRGSAQCADSISRRISGVCDCERKPNRWTIVSPSGRGKSGTRLANSRARAADWRLSLIHFECCIFTAQRVGGDAVGAFHLARRNSIIKLTNFPTRRRWKRDAARD